MVNLFDRLWDQAETNAQRALEVYTADIGEYQALAPESDVRQAVLDFGVFIRRRTLELAADGRPLSDGDLEVIASVGRQRADRSLSLPSQQQALGLHTRLMLEEIQQAAHAGHPDDLLQLIGWFGPQGVRARAAYLRGYGAAIGRSRSLTGRLGLLAKMLLADEPVEADLAGRLGIHLTPVYLVCVIRTAETPPPERRAAVDREMSALPRVPAIWARPDEYVVLLQSADVHPGGATARDLGLERVQEVAKIVGGQSTVGCAAGAVGALSTALATARRVSEVAPREAVPRRLYAVSDVFVELCAAQTPWVDRWLGEFAEHLVSGPDLVATLACYYRHDMNRAATAADLHIHPRTLDYRLRRVRELTGEDPGSARGVRILSTAVARLRVTGLG